MTSKPKWMAKHLSILLSSSKPITLILSFHFIIDVDKARETQGKFDEEWSVTRRGVTFM